MKGSHADAGDDERPHSSPQPAYRGCKGAGLRLQRWNETAGALSRYSLVTVADSILKKSMIRRELYGGQFALTAQDSAVDRTVATIIAEDSRHRPQVLETVRDYLEKAARKSLLHLQFVHSLLLEYLQHASRSEQLSLMDSVCSSALVLCNSLDGALALVHCLGYGGNKEKKAVLKALRGSVMSLCTDRFGYLVIMRALTAVDDTVLLKKTVGGTVAASVCCPRSPAIRFSKR